MPVWVVAALAFGAGVAVGLLVGGGLMYYWWRQRFPARSMLVMSPEGEVMLECQVECLKKYPFGSPEFDDCVGRCYDEKRKQLVVGRETR
jgi:hypothetical protein